MSRRNSPSTVARSEISFNFGAPREDPREDARKHRTSAAPHGPSAKGQLGRGEEEGTGAAELQGALVCGDVDGIAGLERDRRTGA
jgi:hypothetical protein